LGLIVVSDELVADVINAIPGIMAALFILLIGYFVGSSLGKVVVKLVEKTWLKRSFD
jgi:hypothetical protein